VDNKNKKFDMLNKNPATIKTQKNCKINTIRFLKYNIPGNGKLVDAIGLLHSFQINLYQCQWNL